MLSDKSLALNATYEFLQTRKTNRHCYRPTKLRMGYSSVKKHIGRGTHTPTLLSRDECHRGYNSADFIHRKPRHGSEMVSMMNP